jgi:hypothetical protein
MEICTAAQIPANKRASGMSGEAAPEQSPQAKAVGEMNHKKMASLERESGVLHKLQRRGVHAIAQIGGLWPIVENVAEVGVTFRAGNRRSAHP